MEKTLSAMAIIGLLGAASATAASGGELWEITTKMSMLGMDMPGMTQNSCQPKGGAYKPEKSRQRENCEITDMKVSGNKTTWKMHCPGKDAVDGSGEVIRGTDKLNGTMKLSMKNGEMTETILGKRIGTCQAE
jgi:hypothetical protein